jgi:hypothetical protein
MYKDSLVTMNNKNSAIFLAAVLVVGIIGMASPLIGSAAANEEKYKEKRYDSHDYKKDRNYDSYDYEKDYKKDRNYDSYDSHDYKKDRNYDSYDYEKDYKKDMSYDSYDSHDYKKEKKYDYDPYTKDNKYDGSYYSGFKCNANNFNINTFSSKSISKNVGASGLDELSTQQLSELASPQTLGSIFGGGFSLHVKNVCFNAPFLEGNSFTGFVGEDRGE